jgi:FMN reductase
MSQPVLVGFSGSFGAASKTRAVVEEVTQRVAARFGVAREVYDLGQLGPDFGQARMLADLTGTARQIVARLTEADALVIAAPVYKASYPGLFKHLFDLLDPLSLADKPVLLAATGGGDRHALIIEHQLRPLLAFFEAQTLATGLYVSERDFADGRLAAPAVIARLDRAVAQFAPFLPPHGVLRPVLPAGPSVLPREAAAAPV